MKAWHERTGWHQSATLTGVGRVLPQIAADARKVLERGRRFEIRGVATGPDVVLLAWVSTDAIHAEPVLGLLDTPRIDRQGGFTLYGRLEA